jgi:hypothetical protein
MDVEFQLLNPISFYDAILFQKQDWYHTGFITTAVDFYLLLLTLPTILVKIEATI